MTPDLDVYGIFLPAVAAYAVAALVLYLIVKRLLEAVGLYGSIWHRGLFDLSLYVCLFSILALGANGALL